MPERELKNLPIKINANNNNLSPKRALQISRQNSNNNNRNLQTAKIIKCNCAERQQQARSNPLIMNMNDDSGIDSNSPEFLSWRRLYLSKAKLSGGTEMATMMAGFSIVSLVELQINSKDANPYLLISFSIITTFLVSSAMLSIMISTCILPHIVTVEKMNFQCSPDESPHDKLAMYIDLSWVLANTFSIFFFTMDICLLCWIKFKFFSVLASVMATLIFIPVLIGICIIGIISYRNMVKQQSIISDRKYKELEEMKRQLDIVSNISRV